MEMKILIVSYGFPPHLSAGVMRYTRDLLDALSREGNQVSLFYGGRTDLSGRTRLEHRHRNGISFFEAVNSPNMTRNFANLESECTNQSIEKLFTKVLVKTRPDVIQFNSVTTLCSSLILLAKDHGIPTVVRLNNYQYICGRTIMVRNTGHVCFDNRQGLDCVPCMPDSSRESVLFRGTFMKHALSEANQLIAVSEAVKATYVRWGIPHERIDVIRTPTRLPTPPRRRKKRPLEIAFLGNTNAIKGIFIYLNAIEMVSGHLQDVRFHVIGEPTSEILKAVEKLNRKGMVVHLGGSYDRENIAEVTRDISAIVIPSIVADAAPQTLIEAVRLKKIVIGARIGGIPEYIIEGKNGMSFEAGNADDLADKIRFVVNNFDQFVAEEYRAPFRIPGYREHSRSLLRLYRPLLKIRSESKPRISDNLVTVDSTYRRGTSTLQYRFHSLTAEDYQAYVTGRIRDLKNFGVSSLIIWGAGAPAEFIVDQLEQAGISVEYIVDSDKNKHGKTIGGLQILPPDKLKRSKRTEILVLSLGYQDEILTELNRRKFNGIPFYK